eukprot:6215763-Ditylum_brightwellii.AAC.1
MHQQQSTEDSICTNKCNINIHQQQNTINRPKKGNPIAQKCPHAIATCTRSRMKTATRQKQTKYNKSSSNCLNASNPSIPPTLILPPPRIPPMNIPTPKAST